MVALQNTLQSEERSLEDEPSQRLVDFNDPKLTELTQEYDSALEAMRNSAIHFAESVASHARDYKGEMASALSQTSQNLDNANKPVQEKLESYNDPQQVRGWRHQSVFWVPEGDSLNQRKFEDYQPSPTEVKAYSVSTHLIEAHNTTCRRVQDFTKAEIKLKTYLMKSMLVPISNDLNHARDALVDYDKRMTPIQNYFAERARTIRGETAPDATVESATAPEPQPRTPATHSSGTASDDGSPGGSLGEQSRSKRSRTE